MTQEQADVLIAEFKKMNETLLFILSTMPRNPTQVYPDYAPLQVWSETATQHSQG